MNSVEQYLANLLEDRPEWMNTMENYASMHHVPIMDAVSMNFLSQLVRLQQPAEILEIGTAIGYSALRMSEVSPNSHITTIEKDAAMFDLALQNITKQNKLEKINVINGDAREILKTFKDSKNKLFDFVFIDAAKGQYKQYFDDIHPVVKIGGIIVADNVLFRGMVVETNTDASRRMKSLARKINTFNEYIMAREDYHSAILPIGDGVSLSIKIN